MAQQISPLLCLGHTVLRLLSISWPVLLRHLLPSLILCFSLFKKQTASFLVCPPVSVSCLHLQSPKCPCSPLFPVNIRDPPSFSSLSSPLWPSPPPPPPSTRHSIVLIYDLIMWLIEVLVAATQFDGGGEYISSLQYMWRSWTVWFFFYRERTCPGS